MLTKKKMENPQQRKKVWKKNKSGLFGWRTEKIQMEKSTSKLFQNIQTSKSGSDTLHTVSSEKKFLKTDNLLLTAGGGKGGGENQRSYRFLVPRIVRSTTQWISR